MISMIFRLLAKMKQAWSGGYTWCCKERTESKPGLSAVIICVLQEEMPKIQISAAQALLHKKRERQVMPQNQIYAGFSKTVCQMEIRGRQISGLSRQ